MAYAASVEDQTRCTHLIEQLTPSAEQYEGYRARAEHYRSLLSLAREERSEQTTIAGLSWRKSKLFDGARYLVAFVDDEWASRTAPDCDAFASRAIEHRLSETAAFSTPPLVLVPWSRRRARDRAFASVLEHEFVHINQAILGRFPAAEPDPGVEGLLTDYESRVRVEFQANLVQLVRWPEHFPRDAGLTLEHWCALRGHTQALEHLLLCSDALELTDGEIGELLDALPGRLPHLFTELGIDIALEEWFRLRFEQHLRLAAEIVMGWQPEIGRARCFRAVAVWLADRGL